ncbi:MAG: beta-glucosidase [Ktedonobacteraceae bacterium]|nr:beta-glucosidase [Ktedonobacteraceae bacterium]
MAEKLTIRDIAQIAGVSIATVSRVLNNKPDVDPLTRERVMLILKEYNFTPNLSATQLAGSLPRTSRPFHPTFPPDFLWGTATSAYQIEGATDKDGRGACIWDAFAREPGAIYRGQNAEIAADHYQRMEQDVALMAELNLKAYRFSLSWSRILPQGTSTVNEQGLDFYDRLIDALLNKQICPVVTLYHWDLPLALHKRGGWQTRETAEAFADYTEIVARRFGDRVSWWITLNEPWCSAYLGYGIGTHAPGEQSLQAAVNAGHHLLLAHAQAVVRLRSYIQPSAHIGATLNLTPVSVTEDSQAAQEGAERADILYNRWFLDPLFHGRYPEGLFRDLAVHPPVCEDADMALISTPLDFLGINYYSRALIRPRRRAGTGSTFTETYEQVIPVPGATYTEMAWEIYPQGLRDVLLRVQQDYAPRLIMVTENGAAFDDQWDGRNHIPDKRRVQYLREHIQELEGVLLHEVPLCGYFVWSFLDNYEWIDGYSKRFGLVYVDYATQRRVVKQSGRWYAAFIAAQHPIKQTE